MKRPLLFSILSAAAGALSWATLLAPAEGPLMHFGENLTWAFVVGAIICALLAADGTRRRGVSRILVGAGVALAAARAASMFLL